MKLNPVFDDLNNPDTILNHVEELTTTRATPHAEILNQLQEQFEPLDFEALANPHNAENFKLNNKHYTVLSIENVLDMAENNRWGLCKNHDFIYLYNGTYWNQLDKETFRKFLGKAAEKMDVPKFSARYYKFRKELYEQFLGTAYLEPIPPLANRVLINLQNGTFEVSPKGTQLRPFDRSDFLTYQLPFEYNPQAKAPLFEAYLNKVLPDKERQKVLACLIHKPINRWLFTPDSVYLVVTIRKLTVISRNFLRSMVSYRIRDIAFPFTFLPNGAF